jgi:hypothetical protein
MVHRNASSLHNIVVHGVARRAWGYHPGVITSTTLSLQNLKRFTRNNSEVTSSAFFRRDNHINMIYEHHADTGIPIIMQQYGFIHPRDEVLRQLQKRTATN